MTWEPLTYSFDTCTSCGKVSDELLVLRRGEIADEWLCDGCAGRFRSGMGHLGPNQVVASSPLHVSDDPICPYHQGPEANMCKLHKWGNRRYLAGLARQGTGRNVARFPGI